MSDDNERYIDPNSGAAPQPGGFASAKIQVSEGEAEPKASGKAQQESNPVDDAETEHSAASGDTSGTEGSGEGQSEAGAGASDPSGKSDGSDGSEEDDSEEAAKDYSELLDGNVPEVQKYLDKNPDEAEAVKAAEAEGQARKGIVEYEVDSSDS